MKTRNVMGYLCLGAFSILIFLQRLHTMAEPLECDTAFYSVLGEQWRQGRPLYSDLWVNKPPGTVLMYAAAQSVTGSKANALLLLESLMAILTLLGIYAATTWMTDDPIWGLWAAAFWTFSNATPYLEANQPNSEVFVNAGFVWAIAFLARQNLKNADSKMLWLAGGCFAWSSFYKHHAVLVTFIVGITYIFTMRDGDHTMNARIRRAAPIYFPTVFLWAGTFLYFTFRGRFLFFWNAVGPSSAYYAFGSSLSQGFIANLRNSLRPSTLANVSERGVFYSLTPIALAGIPGVLLALKNKTRHWPLILGYAAAAWMMIAIPGRFYSHYYQLLLPPLPIIAGAAGHRLRQAKIASWAVTVWLATLLTILFLRELPLYRLDAIEWSRLKYGETYITVKKMAEEIDRNLLPGETFFNAGYEPGLYYYSDRRPPTGIIMSDDWEVGNMKERFTERIRKDLEDHHPELLITTKFWLNGSGHRELPLMQWALENYKPFPQNFKHGPFLLFARTGGALQARLAASPQKR